MMGPEELLIRGENVSVNGQLVPEGASRLLPGKAAVGTRRCPGPHSLLWDSPSIRRARVRGQLKLGSWVGPHSLPTPPMAVGSQHLEMREPAEMPGGLGPHPLPLQPAPSQGDLRKVPLLTPPPPPHTPLHPGLRGGLLCC